MIQLAILVSMLFAPNSGKYIITMGDKKLGEETFVVKNGDINSKVRLEIKGRKVEMDVSYHTVDMGLGDYTLVADVNGQKQEVRARVSDSLLVEDIYIDGENKLHKTEKVTHPIYLLDNNIPSQIALLLKVMPDSGKFRVWVPQVAKFVDVRIVDRGRGEVVDRNGRVLVTDKVTIAPGYVRYDIYYRGDTMFVVSAMKGAILISLNGEYSPRKEFKPSFKVKKFSVKLPYGKVRGEFDLPSQNPVGVVMLIQGSGDVDRHEIGVFDDIASCLTSHGFIVARYDKPGTGKSYKKEIIGLDELIQAADSVLSKVRRTYPKLPVFVLGHSEGGDIALALGSKGGIAGLILMATPSSPLDTLLLQQVARLMKAYGMEEADIDSTISVMASKLDSVRKSEIKRDYVELPYLGKTPTKWLSEHINFHPVSYASRVHVPVLLLYGSDDLQVPVSEMERLKAAMQPDVRVDTTVIEGVTHFFEDRKKLCEELSRWLIENVSQK